MWKRLKVRPTSFRKFLLLVQPTLRSPHLHFLICLYCFCVFSKTTDFMNLDLMLEDLGSRDFFSDKSLELP